MNGPDFSRRGRALRFNGGFFDGMDRVNRISKYRFEISVIIYLTHDRSIYLIMLVKLTHYLKLR